MEKKGIIKFLSRRGTTSMVITNQYIYIHTYKVSFKEKKYNKVYIR